MSLYLNSKHPAANRGAQGISHCQRASQAPLPMEKVVDTTELDVTLFSRLYSYVVPNWPEGDGTLVASAG